MRERDLNAKKVEFMYLFFLLGVFLFGSKNFFFLLGSKRYFLFHFFFGTAAALFCLEYIFYIFYFFSFPLRYITDVCIHTYIRKDSASKRNLESTRASLNFLKSEHGKCQVLFPLKGARGGGVCSKHFFEFESVTRCKDKKKKSGWNESTTVHQSVWLVVC